ncbi:adenylyl-sulfate kinase [Saccharopolyspora indica]|uniref:adenylyl-sulfate kinase n=1 Tax=Saccharopolyspora indica TaxID=1229659 RepID=UPI0022EABEC7|nr:adenylyl-sulfate kinase [Saccharopolyspora indica]MDA3647999.1 adenylyl-sulfate kinase [Saccharopolyspora indica]
MSGITTWLTGLPSSGKSTIAAAVAAELGRTHPVEVLDGDVLRREFFPELGFSRADREENVRRAGRLALTLAGHGVHVLVPVIAPYRDSRDWVRARHAERGVRFAEVHVDAPLTVCQHRDVKGLYAKADRGELTGLTGVDDPYEAPPAPELRLRTNELSLPDCVSTVLDLVLGAPVGAR